MKNIREIVIEKSQIFITDKKAIIAIALIGINTLILAFSFISGLMLYNDKLLDLAKTDQEYDRINTKITMLIVSFSFNAILNIVYITKIYLAIQKKKIGYVFVIFWFFMWLLFTIGTFVMFDQNIYLRVTNLIVGIGSVIMLLIFFYELQKRKREMDFEKRKMRSQL